MLWWFTDEPSVWINHYTLSYNQNLYTDFSGSSKCRGSLQIDGLSLVNDDKKTGFELIATENNPGLGLLKPTKDSTDLAKWEKALAEAITHVRSAFQLFSYGLGREGIRKVEGAWNVQGWLDGKDGSKTLFCVKEHKLELVHTAKGLYCNCSVLKRCVGRGTTRRA